MFRFSSQLKSDVDLRSSFFFFIIIFDSFRRSKNKDLSEFSKPTTSLSSSGLFSGLYCCSPHHFVHAQIPRLLYQNPLVPIRLPPLAANPRSKKKKKNTGEKMRGRKWRRAKYLRGEGPIKRGLFSTEECAQRWREMKGGKKLLFILSKDRFFFLLLREGD